MTLLGMIVGGQLAKPAPQPVTAFALHLAAGRDVRAVLFYGSILRTGDLDGVIDFYMLTERPRSLAGAVVWPDVSYHEFEHDGRILRAKAAWMTLDQFSAAALGRTIDTTIWARFVQPACLIWGADERVKDRVRWAVADCAVTAARFAAVLGPVQGRAEDFWAALFRQTYAAELRVEAPGRERSILDADPERYKFLLPAAWRSAELAYDEDGDVLKPNAPDKLRRPLRRRWGLLRAMGKPLNVARLVKAAFTFEGAARYAAWKVERHTGVAVPLTPWMERHPLLAAPRVLWRLRRARKAKP